MDSFDSGGRPHENAVILEVLSAVSRAEGVDVLELTPPLGEVVDVDALQQFVAHADQPVDVVFDYRHWEVEVRGGDGVEVTVHPLDARRYECICDTCGTRELTAGLRVAQRCFNDHAADGCEVTLRNVTPSATPDVPESVGTEASRDERPSVED